MAATADPIVVATGSDADFRNAYRQLAERSGEYCGIPMGLEGAPLTVAPQLRYASVLNRMYQADQEVRLVNQWYSKLIKARIFIYRRKDGTTFYKHDYMGDPLAKIVETVMVTNAWDTNSEIRALRTLRKIVGKKKFHTYLTCGMFVERGRSGILYVFRKLRPTLACSEIPENGTKILCGMCLHPIGWYEGTWAGAMCPTDDVIAALLLVRAKEPYFWRKARQWPVDHPFAGVYV